MAGPDLVTEPSASAPGPAVHPFPAEAVVLLVAVPISVVGQAGIFSLGRQKYEPVMMPFFSRGSCQLTLRDVSRISVKLRCPTAPGSSNEKQSHLLPE